MITGDRRLLDDPGVTAAIAASPLARLDVAALERVLEGARRIAAPAGATLRAVGTGPHVELVIAGIVRVDAAGPDGRLLTIRYVRPGGLMGLASLFRPDFRLPGSHHALVDTEVLAIRPDVLRRRAELDVVVAGVLLDELSTRLMGFVAEIPGSAFATVRQRIARHLLDAAVDAQHGPELVARIRQQQLADAVGTAREVVVRILRELRAEGTIATRAGAITILDPAALLAESYVHADGAGT